MGCGGERFPRSNITEAHDEEGVARFEVTAPETETLSEPLMGEYLNQNDNNNNDNVTSLVRRPGVHLDHKITR
jgi:hypothetical protein